MICYDGFECDEPEKIRQLINFAIMVCDETDQLQQLLQNLAANRISPHQIVAVVDSNNTNEQVSQILIKNQVRFYYRPFDYTCNQRNFLKERCWLPYIFFIDADEMLGSQLLNEVVKRLACGFITDTLGIPRLNKVDDQNFEGWPDYQLCRLIVNSKRLKYVGAGHDNLSIDYKLPVPKNLPPDIIQQLEQPGACLALPAVEENALIHIKTSQKLMERGALWERLDREAANIRTNRK